MKKMYYFGLDTHQESIAIAITSEAVGRHSVEPTFERSEATGSIFRKPGARDARFARTAGGGGVGSTESRLTEIWNSGKKERALPGPLVSRWIILTEVRTETCAPDVLGQASAPGSRNCQRFGCGV